MSGFVELNQIRLMAGIPIDPALEIEAGRIDEAKGVELGHPLTDGGKYRFILVQGADADSELNDVVVEIDTRALFNVCRGAHASAARKERWELFPPNKQNEAVELAKRRIASAKKAAPETEKTTENEEMSFDPSVDPITPVGERPAERDDMDQSPEIEVGDVVETYRVGDVVKTPMGKGEIVEDMDETEQDEFFLVQLDDECPEAKRHGVAGDVLRFGSKEFTEKFEQEDDFGEVSRETDVDDSIDDIDMDMEMDGGESIREEIAMSVEKPYDTEVEAKSETPTQLRNPGKSSDAEQSKYDIETKVTVPAKVKNALKSEISNFEAEAKKLDVYNKDTAQFYTDTAKAFSDLLDHLNKGTQYDIKMAQTFAQSLMGPMLHKLPKVTWDYLASGGERRSLKSIMKDVDKKYPKTGPQNKLK